MKITMQQIADIAGVTRATVDKVVHNRPGVRPATREHIQKILTEYNYRLSGSQALPAAAGTQEIGGYHPVPLL
jgi:DNA-binding LacI/PurR family transcriptional regulator